MAPKRKAAKQQQKKAKNQQAGPKVPPTPVSASDEHDKSMDNGSGGPDTKSAPASPYLTPPTSPSSPTIPPLSMDVLAHKLQKLEIDSSADDAATPVPELDLSAVNGSQEEQTDPAQQTQDEVHSVERSTEQERETRAEEQHSDPELPPAHNPQNEDTTAESDEQTSEENNVSGGERYDQGGSQDEDQVQIEPPQQPHDETEKQEEEPSAEPSKPDDEIREDQTQTHSEDLLGGLGPDAEDDHLKDDTAQGESDDTSAKLHDSQESDIQNGTLPEDQEAVDSTPQSQEQEVQQQTVDQQTSDDQAQLEANESSAHVEQSEEAQEPNAIQEPSGDLIQFDLEHNDAQPEDDQDHIREEHAPVTTELLENGQDHISGDDEALEHNQEPNDGDQQLVDDQKPGPGDGQSEGEPERDAAQDPQLDQQGPIETSGDEQEYAHEDQQQADAEDQPHENEQEPVESNQGLHDESEHTPEAEQQLEQGQESETIEGEQAEVEPGGAAEGDQQAEGSEEQETIGSDQRNEGQTVEVVEHVEGDQGLADTHEQLNPEHSTEPNGQFEDEQDVTGNGLDADQVELAAGQQSDILQGETDAADQELGYDSQEDTIGPPEDDLQVGAQSHQEYTSDQESQTEQERIEVAARTLGDNPEDNKLDHQSTDIGDQEDIQIVVQDFDDVFGDEEQDTAYEPELEDIQEETGDDEMENPREGAVLDISAKDVASRDLLVVADLFANMKSTLAMMSSAFDRLGSQTEKMASISLDVKAAEQLKRIKSTLEAQITKHRAEVEALKSRLHAKVKEALEERIRDHLHNVIKGSVQDIIEEKVRQELSSQIPEDLCQQVISHKRQILEVKASLHNSEARRYNALQTFPTVNARLRPLLRPLPTPEQSPVPISISRSSSMGHSTLATPTNSFFQVPAPTPIKRSGSNSLRSTVPDTVPPSPSPFFPRDMTTLFALNPEETKRLLREYGLSSAVASPAVEHPVRPRGLSIVNEDAAEEEDQDVHARDLNTFMAHIGVPYLMIPAPKEKHNQSAPLSSRSRRKLLTPLIIK